MYFVFIALDCKILVLLVLQGKPAPLPLCSYRRCNTGGRRVQLVLLDSKLSGPGPSSCQVTMCPSNS